MLYKLMVHIVILIWFYGLRFSGNQNKSLDTMTYLFPFSVVYLIMDITSFMSRMVFQLRF